jgi:arginyl-tRNA synthetase
VALLGASLGVLPEALSELHAWFDFIDYHPQVHFDTDLPKGLVPTVPGTGKYVGCRIWQGPLVPVVIIKANGQPTYAAHDLTYAQLVKPDVYLTGCEQAGLFAALGLAAKHVPMGLVLGSDGCKMKSNDGDPLLASDALDLVIEQLEQTPEPKKLAWNILAFTFLQASITSNNKFDPARMTKPKAPGMYLTYTLARIHSALAKGGIPLDANDPPYVLSEEDLDLLGLAAYVEFYLHESAEAKDPAPLANYLLTLARGLAKVYAKQSIKGGPAGFQFAVSRAYQTLEKGMTTLGLFPLLEV